MMMVMMMIASIAYLSCSIFELLDVEKFRDLKMYAVTGGHWIWRHIR